MRFIQGQEEFLQFRVQVGELLAFQELIIPFAEAAFSGVKLSVEFLGSQQVFAQLGHPDQVIDFLSGEEQGLVLFLRGKENRLGSYPPRPGRKSNHGQHDGDHQTITKKQLVSQPQSNQPHLPHLFKLSPPAANTPLSHPTT